MKIWTTAGLAAALAGTLALCACKKDGAGSELPKDIPPPSGDTNFTPPEIRRPPPSTDGTKTKIVQIDSGPSIASVAPADSVSRPLARASVPVTTIHPVAKAAGAPPPSKPAAKPVEPMSKAVADFVPGDSKAGPGQEGDWVLQVNVHKSEAGAKAQVATLSSKGIPAYAIAVPTEGAGLAGRYWRVRVGRFKSRTAAQAYGESKIVPIGLNFWIDRKSHETQSGGTP